MIKLVKIKRALISVSDKVNLKKILDSLYKFKIELISSGGTYKEIKKLGFKCKEISEFTNFNEMLDGRVKTLHPKIHAGILSIRNNKKHKRELINNKFEEIDLVIVNFYPFEKIINKTKNLDKVINNIDIGGPTLVRAAAKNFKNVTVLTSANQYDYFLNEINKYKGSTNLSFRYKCALFAFNDISYYDSVISNYLNEKNKLFFPHKKTLHGELIENLRYGENPHQQASFYSSNKDTNIIQLHGKKLSYNNYNDIYSALAISESLENKAVSVIVKHANPCGVSFNKNSFISFENAFNCDPLSAFGGIVSFNFKVNKKLANRLNKNFFEIIIARGFDNSALKILKKKKNLRLIDCSKFKQQINLNSIFHRDSFLLQQVDNFQISKKNIKIVSKKKPNKIQLNDLIFALNVCRHVKSNSIVLAKNTSTIGIGSGQPNRLDSCKIAINKANHFLPKKLHNSIAASDAFFPFTDGIEKLIHAGITAVIQPGGSIRDKEIIKFANQTDTILAFSRTRHFKH